MPDAPSDLVLRLAGFKIKSRPPTTEPVWTRDGREYPASQALALARAEGIEEEKRGGKRK